MLPLANAGLRRGPGVVTTGKNDAKCRPMAGFGREFETCIEQFT
jgi:hypothetical protein